MLSHRPRSFARHHQAMPCGLVDSVSSSSTFETFAQHFVFLHIDIRCEDACFCLRVKTQRRREMLGGSPRGAACSTCHPLNRQQQSSHLTELPSARLKLTHTKKQPGHFRASNVVVGFEFAAAPPAAAADQMDILKSAPAAAPTINGEVTQVCLGIDRFSKSQPNSG